MCNPVSSFDQRLAARSCFVVRRCAAVLAVHAGLSVAAADDQRARWLEPEQLAEVVDPRIDEASGIIASRKHEGIYYTHNDSGGRAEVFALDRRGRVRATIRLAEAANLDWEDIALAPAEASGVFEICVADIGDNTADRPFIVIYRFGEPELPSIIGAAVTVEPKVYRFRYADGPRNAEALIVHPQTGDAYILTKSRMGECAVYLLPAPWKSRETSVVVRRATLKFPDALPLERIVTAADITDDGRRLVTRSYLAAWEWTLPPRVAPRDFDRIFGQNPARIRMPGESQGEAICYTPDGSALLTISELSPTALYEIRRAVQPAAGPTSAP